VGQAIAGKEAQQGYQLDQRGKKEGKGALQYSARNNDRRGKKKTPHHHAPKIRPARKGGREPSAERKKGWTESLQKEPEKIPPHSGNPIICEKNSHIKGRRTLLY